MRDAHEMIRQLRMSGVLDPLQAEAATAIAFLRRVLEPFANIALERDANKKAEDMISGPDLSITPDQVRAARRALGIPAKS